MHVLEADAHGRVEVERVLVVREDRLGDRRERTALTVAPSLTVVEVVQTMIMLMGRSPGDRLTA